MSKEELLRRAEPTVTVGFVPPVLARQVPDPRAGPRAAAASSRGTGHSGGQHARATAAADCEMHTQLYPPGADVIRPWTTAAKDSGTLQAADTARPPPHVRHACIAVRVRVRLAEHTAMVLTSAICAPSSLPTCTVAATHISATGKWNGIGQQQ